MINSNGTNVKTYVGSDGLLHFTDWTGADSVLNFSSGGTTCKLSLTLSGSASKTNDYVTGKASVSGTSIFSIDFKSKTVSVTTTGIKVTTTVTDSGGEVKTASTTATHTATIS